MSVTPPISAVLPPTLAEIRAWARSFASTGPCKEPGAIPDDDADLQFLLDRAIAYLEAITCRAFDDTMPKKLVPIAQEAVWLRIQQLIFWSDPDYAETMNDNMIQSFTAGNYSETRRDPRTRFPGVATGLPQINPNDWLNWDIWLIATPECRDKWSITLLGQEAVAQIPSFEVTEADWGNYGGLYPDDWAYGRWWGSALWGLG